LPTGDGLPLPQVGDLPVSAQSQSVQSQSAPAPSDESQTPDLAEMPMPAMPSVGGHLNKPRLPDSTDNLGAVRHDAAVMTTPRDSGGSVLYALTIGGLLAAASAAWAFGRGIRLGRR
jgi:hypothetical protein